VELKRPRVCASRGASPGLAGTEFGDSSEEATCKIFT
jgi:hypothetical protein